MEIRVADADDLGSIEKIYAYAREQMRSGGNPTQWGNDRPPINAVLNDIRNKNMYVFEEDGRVFAVFSLIIGADPTYAEIFGGKWLDDKLPYGTIHRIASDGTHRGIFEKCLEFCFGKINNIRIDTHENNKAMLHLVEKNGFAYCGVIYVDDGTPRRAFQKII